MVNGMIWSRRISLIMLLLVASIAKCVMSQEPESSSEPMALSSCYQIPENRAHLAGKNTLTVLDLNFTELTQNYISLFQELEIINLKMVKYKNENFIEMDCSIVDLCRTTKEVDDILKLSLPSSLGFISNVVKIDGETIVAYLYSNKTAVMIHQRDFHYFMMDNLKIDLHNNQPGRLLLFRMEGGSILSDIRPANKKCICQSDPALLRLRQKQLVIKNLILMHLGLLEETYTSLEIKIENRTAECVQNILQHKSCNESRVKRSVFSYFFGPSAHDEVRSLNSVINHNFKEINSFAGREQSQMAWLNKRMMDENVKLMDIFDFLMASQIELQLDTMTTKLNTLLVESLELVESQLDNQDTVQIIKLLLKQYMGCKFLKVSASCSRVSSFVPKSGGVMEIRLFHQRVVKKEYIKFICNPVFNNSGVFINQLHHSVKEKSNIKNNTVRLVQDSDFIYKQVPLIVVPVNLSCFELHCVRNVSFSEDGRLEFCEREEKLIRCGKFLLDFRYGSFSHNFLHDSSEFSHVLRLEKEKIQSATFELHQETPFNLETERNPMELDSGTNLLISHDLIYLLSIVLTLLLLGLFVGTYFYCKRPKSHKSVSNGNKDTELATLIQNAQETAVAIDQLINSARERVVESCPNGLGTGQGSTEAEADRNSCKVGASSENCGVGENVAEANLSHSEIVVTSGKKKKIF